MSRCINYYNINQLFTHVKLGSNIAIKNVLQVYVTTITIFYAISLKKNEDMTYTNRCRREEVQDIKIWKCQLLCEVLHFKKEFS